MKRIILSIIISSFLLISGTGCSDYLDIVPEGVASMDNAFSNRVNSEKFLATCYSYLPGNGDPGKVVGFLAGDEYWTIPKDLLTRFSSLAWEIGRGSQNSNAPYMNYWDGGGNDYGGNNLWIGIRDCNIFLDNIHKPLDLEDYERTRWVAEVTFLKAYYHFYLMQLYGPIPLIDRNIEVNAPVEEVRRYREPFDDCVDYVVKLLDQCMEDLPLTIQSPALEMGRITRPIAAAVKAQVLLFAASPLMNGNPDYVNVKDNRGIAIFSQKYDAKKWEKAAKATLEAIKMAESAGHMLYKMQDPLKISETTRTIVNIGEAVTARWNNEIIWGSTVPTETLQRMSMAILSAQSANHNAYSSLAPTFSVAEGFYSSHGVPIEEDNSDYWMENYSDRYNFTTVPDEGINKYILEVGGKTAKMHLNRELRFYGNLYFDRGATYTYGLANDTTALYKQHFYAGEYSGRRHAVDYSVTGYLPKKIIGFRSSMTSSSFSPYRYAFPIIRLADLYLMYAEALNESLSAPNADVYKYVDLVRERAGLLGIVESWQKYSKYPAKPTTKEGMRDIIRQERLNELACEGKRFWDLRRWKVTLPKEVYGWNTQAKTTEDFYRKIVIYERPNYSYREFLWPLKISTVLRNTNLVQNPGW